MEKGSTIAYDDYQNLWKENNFNKACVAFLTRRCELLEAQVKMLHGGILADLEHDQSRIQKSDEMTKNIVIHNRENNPGKTL